MNALRLGFVLVLLGLLAIFPLATQQQNKEPTTTGLATHKVAFADIGTSVTERGTVDAAGSHAVKCDVLQFVARKPNSLKVNWVVDNGTMVKEGDLLVELDDSYLQDQATTQKIRRDSAEADLVRVESDDKLLPDLVKNRLDAAKLQLRRATDDLKKLTEGDGESMRKTYEDALADAAVDVELWRDSVAAVEKSLKDGKTTEGVVKAHRRKLEVAETAYESAKADLQSFKKVNYPKLRKSMEDMVQVARQMLEQEEKSCQTEEMAAMAKLKATRAVLEQEESQYKDLLEKIKKCKIRAPRTGLVAYRIPAQSRGESKVPVLAKGALVDYGQELLTVGAANRFVVKVPINEALDPYLKKGMPATVRLETFPERSLKAHVNSAGAITPEGATGDAKAFQVVVEIDDNVEKLRVKPGLTGLVTITGDAKADHVLVVPVAGVVVPKDKGKKPYCLLLKADGLEEQEVELGLNNGVMVEIKAGLKEGDVVAIDRRVLPGQ